MGIMFVLGGSGIVCIVRAPIRYTSALTLVSLCFVFCVLCFTGTILGSPRLTENWSNG